MQAINPSLRRDRLSKALLAALVPFLFALALLLAAPAPGQAMPPDPIERTPVPRTPTLPPYPIPANGFSWSMAPRFGPMKDGLVNYHWNETTQTYDDFVRATTFTANFDGCRSYEDEDTGTSALTYAWTFDGQTTTNHQCRTSHVFTQGPHTVSVTITGGPTPLGPFTQGVTVKDLLVVSLGDSYGAGEGSPDVPQVFYRNNLGIMQVVPARWESQRCHRSANAPAAQAALQLENSDPHTSVTFMSFACSGATINRIYYADQSPFQPYRPSGESSGEHLAGSGVTGPYAGRVPVDPWNPEDNLLPSQLQQLQAALGSRQVDALIISAGGNDMGFGNIAGLCTLFENCQNYLLNDSSLPAPKTLSHRVQLDIAGLPDRYNTLATRLAAIPMAPNGKVYLTEYPDPTRNDTGGYCSSILGDVIPSDQEGRLQMLGALDGASQPPRAPFAMAGSEVSWAGGYVSPMLNSAIAAAVNAHAANGWVLVNGIADSTGNLFLTHGYCATDSWIRHAQDAVNRQGPWTLDGSSQAPPSILWFPNTMNTTGTLHPTERGYQAVGSRILYYLQLNLLGGLSS